MSHHECVAAITLVPVLFFSSFPGRGISDAKGFVLSFASPSFSPAFDRVVFVYQFRNIGRFGCFGTETASQNKKIAVASVIMPEFWPNLSDDSYWCQCFGKKKLYCSPLSSLKRKFLDKLRTKPLTLEISTLALRLFVAFYLRRSQAGLVEASCLLLFSLFFLPRRCNIWIIF